MAMLLWNPEGDKIHVDPPHPECNAPTARREGETGLRHMGPSEAEVRMQGKDPPSLCRNCFDQPKDEAALEGKE